MKGKLAFASPHAFPLSTGGGGVLGVEISYYGVAG
jgi:hypothetical protein